MSKHTIYALGSILLGLLILFVGVGGSATILSSDWLNSLHIFFGLPMFLIIGSIGAVSFFASMFAIFNCLEIADDLTKNP